MDPPKPVETPVKPQPDVIKTPIASPPTVATSGTCSGSPGIQQLCSSEYTLKYFFNATSRACQSYYDGGCDYGLSNSYFSRSECRQVCLATSAEIANNAASSLMADPYYNAVYYNDYLASLNSQRFREKPMKYGVDGK